MGYEPATLRVGVDVGGTFTDLVALDMAGGERIVIKRTSTPRAPEEGVLAALDDLFSRFTVPPRIEYLAHSTTIATNALLGQMQLELPRVVFVTTEGFADVIEIGRQNRSEVYNLFVTRPKPLVARGDRVPVRERIDAHGNVLTELDDDEVTRTVERVRTRTPDTIAVGLLHAHVNDVHERRLARRLAEAFPNVPVTYSAQVDREYREYERFSTTLVNAALLPIVERYVRRLREALNARGIDTPLYVMQSNGGMVGAGPALLPAALIESGPASGVVAAARLAEVAGLPRVLSFDMGGTTAKAGSVLEGNIQVATEFEAAGATHSGRSVKGSGYPVRFPFVDLAEISAGGGTIAWIDEADALRVGPISAGADPGPACYGRSPRATVTDANLVLGRLNPHALAGGTFPIDVSRAHDAVDALAAGLGLSREATAAGIVAIVDAQMARVLRIVTVERGLDPREFAMVAFGGNGPLHACALADELGIARVIVPHDPGVFSAQGLLGAQLRAHTVQALLQQTDDLSEQQIARVFDVLEEQGRQALRAQGVAEPAMSFVHAFDARYRGQSFELEIPGEHDGSAAAKRFHHAHRVRYGYDVANEPVELVSARVTAVAALAPLREPPHRNAPGRAAKVGMRQLYLNDRFVRAAVYERAGMAAGEAIEGPAIIEQYDSTIYVAPLWRAVAESAMLNLERYDG